MFVPGKMYMSSRISWIKMSQRYSIAFKKSIIMIKTDSNKAYAYIFIAAVCRPKCGKHGKCIGPGLCLCREGYGGANCNLKLKVEKISIAKMTTPRSTAIYFQKKKNRLKKKRTNHSSTKITILTL